MTDAPRRGALRWLRSIRVQAFALLVILIVLPALIFAVLGNAEAERRLLIRNAVAETGDTIAAGLLPVLRDIWPADLATLRSDLGSRLKASPFVSVVGIPMSSRTWARQRTQ